MFSNIPLFQQSFTEKLEIMLGKSIDNATSYDCYLTLGVLIREYISKKWMDTNTCYTEYGSKQVYYFSMEFLIGRLLESNLINLGIRDICVQGLQELGISFEEILEQEPDAGLGNGGLGRLAACFLDSLASQQLPGHGSGIRYKYGFFEQKIMNGYQVELPEYWLKDGYVWEIRRPDKAVEVKFGGHVQSDSVNGLLVFFHEQYEIVLAVPYDVPVIGYQTKTVNTLRLWSAESAVKPEQKNRLQGENYQKIVEYKRSLEAISEFLYPDDSTDEGKLLRLKQQYFLVSAGIQSIVNNYKKRNGSVADFHQNVAIHVNDTHPVLAIPELMRIFMDEEGLGWDEAWHLTSNTVSYTNHTILAEALETWPIEMFRKLLPRIYMIVDEINERFCRDLWNRYPQEWDRIHKMAIIADGYVKMAHLAIAGSHSINGVAKLHTEILKKREMNLFYQFYPYKFNNKTNGITHRRWLLKANPQLAGFITDAIGASWITHPTDLMQLLRFMDNSTFQEGIQQIKQSNKKKLATMIYSQTGIVIDESSIFDVQIKRLHAYKRQLMNVFHILDLYRRLRENPDLDILPRTFIFGAKAASGYQLAKRVIKLIHAVADKINNDTTIRNKLKVVFLENYRVSLAESIIPAADVSEQISTASKEASGTGNMKFMMNGALTIGTLDGANVEIHEKVGSDHMFVFGLSADEVIQYYMNGNYQAWDMYSRDERIKTIMDQLVNGYLSPNRAEFQMIYDFVLAENDQFFLLADFASYVDAHARVDQAYRDRGQWLKKCIINIAHSGDFSSDRTINDYAKGIWDLHAVHIP